MKRLPAFSIVLLIIFLNINIVFAQQPSPDAGAYILIDSDTGEILCEKNARTPLYPASTTKIMTAILALEMSDLDHIMTAGQSAIDDIGPNGSNIGIVAGERIRLENLLQALLISSANEAANIIADNLCDSREDFIALMNRRAREFGASNTHFANTSGIHDPEHYATASDIAIFARYAMKLQKFREIVSMPEFTMPATNKHAKWPVLPNRNKLMTSDKSDLYVVNGIKTGFTGPAGHNLVSSAINEDGMELIAVVMGVKNANAAENVRLYSKELLDYGFNNFRKVNLVEKDRIYRNVNVENASDVFGLDLVTTESLTCVLPNTQSVRDNITEIPHIAETISAPVNQGDIMGYIEFFRNNVLIGKVELIAARSVEHKPGPVPLTAKLENILNSPVVRIGLYTAGFLLLSIIVIVLLRHISRKTNQGKYS